MQVGASLGLSPRPGVAEPDGGKNAKISGFRATVRGCDLDEDVLAIGLRIFHKNVKVAVSVEDASIEQLILWLQPVSTPVLFCQFRIGELRLRVLVEIAHIGVRGGTVEVEVVFLDVLTVISLVPCEAKNPLFQDGVALIPQGQCETDRLPPVADSRQTIFVPTVGTRTGMIMR